MVLPTLAPRDDVVHLEWFDRTADDTAATVAADHVCSQAAPRAGAPALSQAAMTRAVRARPREYAAGETGAEGHQRSTPGVLAALLSRSTPTTLRATV